MKKGPQPGTSRGHVSEPWMKRLWYEKRNGNSSQSCSWKGNRIRKSSPTPRARRQILNFQSSRIPDPAQLPVQHEGRINTPFIILRMCSNKAICREGSRTEVYLFLFPFGSPSRLTGSQFSGQPGQEKSTILSIRPSGNSHKAYF